MSKPKFYQAVLQEVNGNVLDHVYPHLKGKGQLTMTERMGNENAECSECSKNKWLLYPKESIAVSQGGKPYMECMNCGQVTHL